MYWASNQSRLHSRLHTIRVVGIEGWVMFEN
jgi:hypothetical protein